MDKEVDSPNSEVEENDLCWTLDNIPKEIFLHICSFLSMKFIKEVLRNVCQRFADIVDDDINWKIRLKERWPKKYPLIRSDEFTWCEACNAREEAYWLWSNQAENMKKCHIAAAHFASVDVVHFIEDGQFCASGARDHAIKLWNMEDFSNYVDESEVKVDNGYVDTGLSPYPNHNWIEAAHSGWIWCMAYSSFHKNLYSGSWDSTVKTWDINNFSGNTAKSCFKVASAVLCMALCGDVLSCGRYDKKVSVFDLRIGSRPILQKTLHKKSVLGLTMNEKYIISASYDGSVVVFDRVAGKTHKTIKLDGFPMSLSYAHNHLWVGDKQGNIHLIDPTCDRFELIKSYPSGHTGKITGIHFSLGSIVTCSMDKSISILEPSAEPKPIITLPYQSQVAGITVHGNKVVSANTDSSITIWLPFSETSDQNGSTCST